VSSAIETTPESGGNAPRGLARWLFPDGVRLRHFIIIPAATMALLIALFRWIDHLVAGAPDPFAGSVYPVLRTFVIGVGMVSVIASLMIRHRREYEARLQKRTDDLEATRDFLSNVIESSGEAIITLDADWRTTSWNRAAENIYGWSFEEMAGQTLDRLLPPGPEFEQEKARAVEKVPAGRTLRHYETSRVRKDGGEITVHVTHAPLFDAGGRFVGSTVTSHDMTEVKKLWARLREQERLASLGQLAAAVAHEVKNPLAGIRGACDILAKGYGEDDRRFELGQEVLRQVDRLTHTVRDLLLFARPKTKKPVPTDIHLVLERVLKLIREDPQSRLVEVERLYDLDMPLLHVDPQQVEQVFFNVVVNAHEAMDHRGTLTVATEQRDAEAWIVIRDTGRGIPQDAAKKVFEPFFTTRTRGSGLGLAIVKNIVQAHDGTVTATSPAEGGTEIAITLPMKS
jgi:PAS domain S-box-containing protein